MKILNLTSIIKTHFYNVNFRVLTENHIILKEINYKIVDEIVFEDQKKINAQLDKMINYKYQFISYNGLRSSHLNGMTNGGTLNPFSNKVIIIDEAHNFISRIVNKLTRKTSLSMKLYNYLMDAENCKIILLTVLLTVLLSLHISSIGSLTFVT